MCGCRYACPDVCCSTAQAELDVQTCPAHAAQHSLLVVSQALLLLSTAVHTACAIHGQHKARYAAATAALHDEAPES
jgi:hypothetical protein